MIFKELEVRKAEINPGLGYKDSVVILLNLSKSRFCIDQMRIMIKFTECAEKPQAHKGSTSQKDIRPRLSQTRQLAVSTPPLKHQS